MTLLRQLCCVLCICTCPNSISCYLKPKLHPNCCFQVLILQLLDLLFLRLTSKILSMTRIGHNKCLRFVNWFQSLMTSTSFLPEYLFHANRLYFSDHEAFGIPGVIGQQTSKKALIKIGLSVTLRLFSTMSSVNTRIIPIVESGINSLVLVLVLPKEDVLTATAVGIHLPHPDTTPATKHPPTYP